MLRHVLEAVKNIDKAGFRIRHMEVNGYCLYGMPGERIANVVDTALFVSEVIGSIIPMLFAPVPSTYLFDQYKGYYRQQGWCEPDGTVRDLQLVNGKLYPFLKMNEGSVNDYVELQRMMFMLNVSYRSKSFNVFGESAVAKSFRQAITNHEVGLPLLEQPAPESALFGRDYSHRSLPVISPDSTVAT